MTITVLALDIAMHRTGWALGCSDGTRPTWGCFETDCWEKRQGENLCRFGEFLFDKARTHGVTHLVTEKVFVDVRGTYSKAFQFNGTQAQMMLQAIAIVTAHSGGLAAFEVDISHWRQHFLGHNRKPKDMAPDAKYWKDVAVRVAADRGWYVTHHDEAEALGIMDYALAQLDRSYDAKTVKHGNKQVLDQMLKRGAIHG